MLVLLGASWKPVGWYWDPSGGLRSTKKLVFELLMASVDLDVLFFFSCFLFCCCFSPFGVVIFRISRIYRKQDGPKTPPRSIQRRLRSHVPWILPLSLDVSQNCSSKNCHGPSFISGIKLLFQSLWRKKLMSGIPGVIYEVASWKVVRLFLLSII